jgi:polyhydroxybutyrate depolymerase
VESGGRSRTAVVHVAARLPPAGAPLVLVLHGAGSDSARFEAKTGYDELADRDGFIVAYPDGVLDSGSSRTWNAGSCCPPASTTGVDDVSFLVGLVDRLASTLPVDRSRVYAVGHSNGAMMAQRLGCEASGRFAAVASVAGALEVAACVPARPVAMMEIHGTADGQVSLAAAVSGVDSWRRADRCGSTATTKSDGPVSTQTWECDQGAVVQLVRVAGADHPWPGGRTPPPAGQRASDALDATTVTWAFLSTFALPS